MLLLKRGKFLLDLHAIWDTRRTLTLLPSTSVFNPSMFSKFLGSDPPPLNFDCDFRPLKQAQLQKRNICMPGGQRLDSFWLGECQFWVYPLRKTRSNHHLTVAIFHNIFLWDFISPQRCRNMAATSSNMQEHLAATLQICNIWRRKHYWFTSPSYTNQYLSISRQNQHLKYSKYHE